MILSNRKWKVKCYVEIVGKLRRDTSVEAVVHSSRTYFLTRRDSSIALHAYNKDLNWYSIIRNNID